MKRKYPTLDEMIATERREALSFHHSLTRRGHTLIARRKVTVEQSQNGVIGDWREFIEGLFDEQVSIYSIDVDREHNLRVRFTPHFSYMPFDNELDALPHNATVIKANWQEVA